MIVKLIVFFLNVKAATEMYAAVLDGRVRSVLEIGCGDIVVGDRVVEEEFMVDGVEEEKVGVEEEELVKILEVGTVEELIRTEKWVVEDTVELVEQMDNQVEDKILLHQFYRKIYSSL